MMKKVLSIIFFFSTAGLLMAQGGYGPQAGNISLSLLLGRAESFGNVQYVNQANSYYINSPVSQNTSASSNSLTNMIGVEGKYFLASNIAVRVSGLGIISNSPAQQEIEGIGDATTGTGTPTYNYVESSAKTQLALNIGGDYYFPAGNRVFPYAGGQFNMNYGSTRYFSLDENELGERIGEAYGLGGSIVGGVDYYISDGLFLGIEVKALGYMYNVAKKHPYAGIEPMAADNHTLSFFSNPLLKLGFKF